MSRQFEILAACTGREDEYSRGAVALLVPSIFSQRPRSFGIYPLRETAANLTPERRAAFIGALYAANKIDAQEVALCVPDVNERLAMLPTSVVQPADFLSATSEQTVAFFVRAATTGDFSAVLRGAMSLPLTRTENLHGEEMPSRSNGLFLCEVLVWCPNEVLTQCVRT